MAFDPPGAALVVQDFRSAEAPGTTQSASIKATYDKSPIIEINTNLDATGGQALADDIASMSSVYSKMFNVVVEGSFFPEDFTGGAPRYTLSFSRHNTGAQVYQVVGVKTDFFTNRTTLTVRG